MDFNWDYLDDFVNDHRFDLAVVFPLVGFLAFVLSFEGVLPDFLSYNPFLILFGVFFMRLPLLVGAGKLIDWLLGIGLMIMVFYTYLIEFVGVSFDWPYGAFNYGVSLGPMINDLVPLALPLFFIPLVFNSYIYMSLVFREYFYEKFYVRFFSSVIFLIFIDLILDPGAVSLNFWSYSQSFYYGVPLSNYLGWVLSASMCYLILEFTFNLDKLKERTQEINFILDDLVSFAIFWGLINFYFGNTVPVIFSGMIISSFYTLENLKDVNLL